MLRSLSAALRVLYGAAALVVFGSLFAVAALLALAVPTLRWRRRVVSGLAHLGLLALGLRVSASGLAVLPADACVVTANHSSYLDGVVLAAILPPRFSFVIKREAAALPVVGLLLRRVGSEFVDRHTHGGRHRDARRVLRRAELGHSLVFFPEGTFDERPGLKRFHVGAFVAAARTGMSVVPVAILGARRALPPESIIPRPGRIRVEILGSLVPPAAPHAAEALRDEARRMILARLDEPDLAQAAATPDRT